MNFEEMTAVSKVILTEGGIVERIRRDPIVSLDPFIAHSGLIYDQQGRAALTRIYREYIDIARTYNLPMMSYAPPGGQTRKTFENPFLLAIKT
ncbi:MAG: hypothetical protein MUF15_13440 [Acidobacteria bacterium]|jgi:hypothetical protein|nr:hypothetical protein [Acidobacteriota bacterium]